MPAAAAAIRSRWKNKFSFVHHRHHNHPSPPISSNSAPCSPSPSSSSIGVGVGVAIGIGIGGPPPTPSRTPMSFICPISSSLMFDPVIIPTGHTFERACIEACKEFNFTPPTLSSVDLSSSSFLLIPNAALRAAIIDWCDHFALPHPSPLSQDSARALVQNLILRTTHSNSNSSFPQQEDYSTTTDHQKLMLQRQQQPSSSSSSSSYCSYPSSSSASSFSSSDIHQTAASTSSSSSSSSSSSLLLVDADPKSAVTATTAITTVSVEDSEAESILVKLKSPQISVKQSGLVTLRHSARESSQRRISLCTPSLLSALVPMLLSTNPTIQINATAALVNLSIEPTNKVKIVRSGAVPTLVEALRSTDNHSEEARFNAAGALFSLALDDENKLPIGVLGAIPPLVNLFCQAQQQQSAEFAGAGAGAGHDVARVEAGMALYHLSLAPNNLSKIAKTEGAVRSILAMATANANANANANADDTAGAVKGEIEEEEEGTVGLRLRRVAMMLLANLARRNEGRVALMDAGAVKAMVGIMKGGAGGREEEYCLAVMYEMSKGSLRFRALARAAGAERVLLAMAGNGNKEGRGEVGKEMARRTLKVIRGEEEKGVMLMLGDEYDAEEEEEEEEVGSVVSDGLVSFRRRRYDDFGGGSGANSANF